MYLLIVLASKRSSVVLWSVNTALVFLLQVFLSWVAFKTCILTMVPAREMHERLVPPAFGWRACMDQVTRRCRGLKQMMGYEPVVKLFNFVI